MRRAIYEDDVIKLLDKGWKSGVYPVASNIHALPSAQPEQQHGRIFQEIVVEYPSISTYPEYKGKPYFSIKYTENGQEFIGYGTYKPEVLSEYLKEYFIPSAQPERSSEIQDILDYLDTVLHPIISPEHWNVYSELHDMISTLPYAQPEPKWIPCSERLPEKDTCFYLATIANHGLNFTTTLPDDVDVVRWDYDRRKGHNSWHWCTERTVIAWMPLPEPYKEGEKSERQNNDDV